MRLDWKMSGETMGLSALIAGDAAAFLSGMNPSIYTIRSPFGREGGDNTAKDIHIGMVIANVLTILVGWGATAITGSWWPVTVAAAVSVALDLAYEWALRSPRQ